MKCAHKRQKMTKKCEAKKKINKQQIPESRTHFGSPRPHPKILGQLREASRNRPRSTECPLNNSREVPTRDRAIQQGKAAPSTEKSSPPSRKASTSYGMPSSLVQGPCQLLPSPAPQNPPQFSINLPPN